MQLRSQRDARTLMIFGLLLCCLWLSSCSLFGGVGTAAQQKPTPVSAGALPVSNGPVDHPVATSGCGRASPVAAGTSADQTFAVNPAEAEGNSTRSYRVHVPTGYQSTVPVPLVLYFHGFGGDALGGDRGSGFTQLADQHRFIVAYGQGLPEGVNGPLFWANSGLIDYGVDDAHYVSLMLDDLQSKFCVDARRIFETGFSNGGGLSGYLACVLAGRIAAFAPVSGNFYYFPGGCHPVRSVPILEIHGSADPLLLYQGYPDPSWPLPSIPQWLHDWATRDGCQQGPQVFLHTAQVTGERWTNCRDGAQIVHYRVEGGGHSWPSTLGEQSSLEVIWSFFQAHPLPA